jgi:hypothetical protein
MYPLIATLKSFPLIIKPLIGGLTGVAKRLKGGSDMKLRGKNGGLWGLIGALLILAVAQPTASGLDFPTSVSLTLPDHSTSVLLVSKTEGTVANLFTSLDSKATVFSSELAAVSLMSRKIEAARQPLGAKKFAKEIMLAEYGWGDDEYKCLNRLWNKESHWNYQARNPRSGAHGIAQALPATKMDTVNTDWRTNPLTQIRWGLSYIANRYEEPCTAFAKWKRSHYY